MQGTVGIIDGYVTAKPENVNFYENAKINNTNATHGDTMIQFVHEYSPN